MMSNGMFSILRLGVDSTLAWRLDEQCAMATVG